MPTSRDHILAMDRKSQYGIPFIVVVGESTVDVDEGTPFKWAPREWTDAQLLAAWRLFGGECGDGVTVRIEGLATEMARRNLDF